MVVTRSQGDTAEMEERRPPSTERQDRLRERELRLEAEQRRIELERLRRLSLEPPASPRMTGTTTATLEPTTSRAHLDLERPRSPTQSMRSTTSVTTRLRMAELEAAERLAAIKRKELEVESDLVKKRLAVEVSVLRDEQESLREEPLVQTEDPEKVDRWLRANPSAPRGNLGENREDTRQLHFETPRARSPTPVRSRTGIAELAATLDRIARPRLRHTDLPTFSGAASEWMPFIAAVRDTTNMYQISPAENLQRLRSCLKGEAREAVAALLHTATEPDQILKTLEQCFGRPEVIIDRTLEDLKKMPKPGTSATELNTFAIKLQNTVCVLRTIDRRGYLHNPMMTRDVLEKLSPHLRSRWCDYAEEQQPTEEPELVLLSRFLMREADRALKYTYTSVAAPATTAKRESRPAAASAAIKRKPNIVYTTEEEAETVSKTLCPACEQEHLLPKCPKYKALAVDQRWELVKSKRLCFRCIQSTHRRFNCKAKACGVNQCRRPHHSTLHAEKTDEKEDKTPTKEAVLSVATRPATGPRSVLLKMCPVVIVGPKGEARSYALLDEGATITLIDEDLAKSVGAEGPSQPLHLRGVNMTQNEKGSQLVTVKIRGVKHKESFNMRARTMKDLRLHQQSIPDTVMRYSHLRDLPSDEVCYDQAQPGILVGTDHWEYIVSRELKIGGPGEPAASRTQLGWVVHGTIPQGTIVRTEQILHVYEPDVKRNDDERLHELVDTHFKIEALGIAHKPKMTDANKRAMAIVNKTTAKIDGGYEVGLPWRHDETHLPPSYNAALRRLRKVEQKMDASPEFAEKYTAQIENLLQKAYAVPCDGSEAKSPVCWYLPHFAVQNPNKPGKQRLVFDAAAKSHGVSLNDHLLEGPDLLLSLPGILFRFREDPVAVTADIQEMFLRIKIRPEDQPAQQFLWRGSRREGSPQRYKMTSMIFGAASSPYTAHHVRNHNARNHRERYPRALQAITCSHYMDDYVASYRDANVARQVIHEVRTVHAAAGFTLRGWSSNDVTVLQEIPRELRASSPTSLGGEHPESKILGLVWNADKDELGFSTTMSRVPTDVRNQSRTPTKREALSAVMSIYDPLGLLSQYTIRAKIVLQSLWRLQISWDEPIPEEEGELFASWLTLLEDISTLRLPRCYTTRYAESIELHVLCDASEQAYATVAYWRIIRPDGSIHIALVAAKAKVAPRRVQTIPRLELQAAVIGARLADTIKKEHGVEVARTIYWTDSTTVVHWIHHDAKRYTPFVAHRLGEIAELTKREEWRWVPTEENVADDATRLIHTSIDRDDRWFQGPKFLHEPEEHWPVPRLHEPEAREAEVLHVQDQRQRYDWLPDVKRFSKYETLVRATALVLAFVDIRVRRIATRLECRHLHQAELLLMKRAQEESFGEDIKKIEAARCLKPTSRLYKLDPVLEKGLLRVRSRIEAATVPTETKRPVILDGRHPLTKLLVLREHCAAGHANRERVTNDLRQRYWILRLRPTVRAVERGCAYCRVYRAKPQVPAPGDLPRARLDPFHRPFSNCGIDYFGPMLVKVGRRREKRWGALFTCLTSRAVHIELVPSLTTDSALMALRRMAARRGWPKLIYSDNATNFRGANQELRVAYAEWVPALQTEVLLHRTEWRFIPPGAPNQGGAWERLVRSVKTALSATLRERVPSEEVLHTLLVEAEFTINARPLTHVSVSPDDPEALTPNHFLLGSSNGLPTTGPCNDADRRTWRVSQALADHFWRRWLKEYLPTLIPRGESKNNTRPVAPGDLVVVVDHTLPRNVWPRGVVEHIHPGPDGSVRVVDVRTKSGTFRRPVSKLVVLLKKEATRAAPGGESVADNEHDAGLRSSND